MYTEIRLSNDRWKQFFALLKEVGNNYTNEEFINQLLDDGIRAQYHHEKIYKSLDLDGISFELSCLKSNLYVISHTFFDNLDITIDEKIISDSIDCVVHSLERVIEKIDNRYDL